MIRVVLADDHALVRDGLRAVLAQEPDIQVVGEAADGREALGVTERANPDVVLVDLSMPLLNGLDVARQLAARDGGPRTILITMHVEDRYVLDALRAGVQGYVLKKQAAVDVVRAIREVAAGRVYLSPGVGGKGFEGSSRSNISCIAVDVFSSESRISSPVRGAVTASLSCSLA